ncbi:MAG: insulinase family protein [Myxococcota bacterium]
MRRRLSSAVGLLGEVYERDRSGKRLPAEDSLRRKIFEKGASYGWSVSHDLSHVGIDGYVEDLSDYLEQLARAVRLPRRSEQMFAAYRSSYIHELEELEPKDGPTWSALVERAAFGTRHPYARAPLGRISDLRELSLEAVIDRQDSLLTPREATLLVVGAVDVAKTHRAAQRWFGAWRAGAPPRRRRAPTPARPPRQPEALFVSVPHAKLAKICAARRLGDLRRLEDGQVELLAEVLAGGFGSRLFARLRDTHGVSYAPTGRLLRRRYARAMLICTQVPADRATEGLRYMRETLVDLRERPPEPLELERARAQLSARAAGRAASIPALVGHALEEIALGRPPRLPSGELVPIALQAQLLEARRWRFVLAGPIAPLKRAARANGLKPRRFALR